MKRYVVISAEGKWLSLNVDDFSKFDQESSLRFSKNDTVISFQVSDLVREFEAKRQAAMPNIIDLESFDLQMSQVGSDIRQHQNWKILKILRQHQLIDETFRLQASTLKPFLEHVATYFKAQIDSENGEKQRLESVEFDINRIIYETQRKGIRISSVIAKRKCHELERRIFEIKNTFQLKHGIFMPEHLEEQLRWLDLKGYNVIRSVLYTFKIWRNIDQVCGLFYELLRCQQDLDSLLLILGHWGGQRRAYPNYVGFGSITGRITMRQPAFQSLRKEIRPIIIPDSGKILLYIDYSQFEAGILASLSEDAGLIALYETDIYEDLANTVFNNEALRTDAKIVFYRYMYGDKTLGLKEKSYFKKFKKLEGYRQTVEEEIQNSGKIGTILGNYRLGSEEECTWALSHRIQATGSLIFKNALIRVHREVVQAEFLIPMHDAALYQIRSVDHSNCKSKIVTIFKEEFQKICPNVKIEADCQDFYTNM